MPEDRLPLKRGRDEWIALVDRIASNTSTGELTRERIAQIDAECTVAPDLVLRLRDETKLFDQARNERLHPQVTMEEGFHAQPIPLRVTDLFSRKVGSGHTGVDVSNAAAGDEKKGSKRQRHLTERIAVEIGPTIHQLLHAVPETDNVLGSDVHMGTTSRLTAGFRRNRGLKASYPTPDFVPIILVPSAPSAPLQAANVRAFLEEGTYIQPSDLAESREIDGGEDTKPEQIMVGPDNFFSPDVLRAAAFRKFRVLSDPRQVDNWDHVCACVVTGATWQFNGWFGDSRQSEERRQPSVLFDFMRGFLAFFEEDRVPVALSTWKVHPLYLTRKYVKANAHIAQAFAFWEELYKFLVYNPRFAHYTGSGYD